MLIAHEVSFNDPSFKNSGGTEQKREYNELLIAHNKSVKKIDSKLRLLKVKVDREIKP